MTRSLQLSLHDRRDSNSVSPIDVHSVSGSFHELKEQLHHAEQTFELLQGNSPPRRPLFHKVYPHIARMEHAIECLKQEANKPPDFETDPFFDAPRELRNAIRELSKRAANRIDRDELTKWCLEFPIDWNLPEMVKRAAKIYLLSQDPLQNWEIRYRSNAPGKPYVLLTQIAKFPGLNK